MPRDRKYNTKNTNYRPGKPVTQSVEDIVETVKYGSEPGYRTSYHKDTGLISSAHNRVKKLKEKILGKGYKE